MRLPPLTIEARLRRHVWTFAFADAGGEGRREERTVGEEILGEAGGEMDARYCSRHEKTREASTGVGDVERRGEERRDK